MTLSVPDGLEVDRIAERLVDAGVPLLKASDALQLLQEERLGDHVFVLVLPVDHEIAEKVRRDGCGPFPSEDKR